MKREYNCVLFDLDGTVLDTSPGIIEAVDEAITSLKLPELSQEQKRSMIGPPIERSFQRIYGLTEEAAAAAAAVFRQAYAEKYLLDASAYPGILELLKQLREDGWKTGVATYKRDSYAQRLMRQKGITALCDVVLGSEGGRQTKADIIQLCLSGLDCPDAAHCIMVGDTLHDWEGARQAGAGFVGVTYGFGFSSAGEIAELGALGAAASAAELGDVLRRLRGGDTRQGIHNE